MVTASISVSSLILKCQNEMSCNNNERLSLSAEISIVFFGLGEKAYRSISLFLERYGSLPVAAVVAARDRGTEEDCYEQLKDLCKKNNISFYDKSHVPVFDTKAIRLAIGWRWMLDDHNLIVFHDSLLPKYRGFAPLVNALINGEREIGVTALHASKAYDAGPVIFQERISIDYPIKIKDAIYRVSMAYASLVSDVYTSLISGKALPSIDQDVAQVSFSLWRDEQDYFLSWEESSETLKRFCDAVGFPYGGARCRLNGETLLVHDVEVVPDVNVEMRRRHLGKVIFFEEGCPIVVCGRGLLKIIDYAFADGRPNRSIPFRSRFS